MDITYKVRGADGQEYGPVSLEDISSWLRDNRIAGESEVMRSDMTYWACAKDFAELKPALPVVVPAATPVAASGRPTPFTTRPTATAAAVGANPMLAAQLKSGASWFYWIAGLTLVNSITAATGMNWRFILGLGVTQISDVIGQTVGGAGNIVALIVATVAAGIFITCGIFANKQKMWAFIVGMILFALDGVISLLIQDWIGLGFHAFALYFIFRGFAAARAISRA